MVGQKIRQGNKSLETGKTDPQTKSSDNSLELGPLHREPASIAPRVSGTRQLVPEPSKWVGGVVVLVVDVVVVVVVGGGGGDDDGFVIVNSYQSLSSS